MARRTPWKRLCRLFHGPPLQIPDEPEPEGDPGVRCQERVKEVIPEVCGGLPAYRICSGAEGDKKADVKKPESPVEKPQQQQCADEVEVPVAESVGIEEAADGERKGIKAQAREGNKDFASQPLQILKAAPRKRL